jgi:hypothetical protein
VVVEPEIVCLLSKADCPKDDPDRSSFFVANPLPFYGDLVAMVIFFAGDLGQ